MQRKIIFHSSPDILWYVTDVNNTDKILKKGLVPDKFGDFDIPGIRHGQAIYAVHMGDYETAQKLRDAADINNPVIIEFIAKSYYECIDEQPETDDEYDFIRTSGKIHVKWCAVPEKVKPKWIRSVTEM